MAGSHTVWFHGLVAIAARRVLALATSTLLPANAARAPRGLYSVCMQGLPTCRVPCDPDAPPLSLLRAVPKADLGERLGLFARHPEIVDGRTTGSGVLHAWDVLP